MTIYRGLKIAGLALTILVASPWVGAKSYYGGQEQGYWWYKDPPKPKPPVEKPPLEPEESKATEAKEKPPEIFSVQWLRENFDRIRDEAIEDPDNKDKVSAYLYAVRMVMDKAQNFADAAHDVAMTDPYLDNNNRAPLTGQARRELGKMQAAARKEVLKEAAKVSGIWFFFDTRCKFCAYQYRILQTFQTYNPDMQMRSISMDGGRFPGMTNLYRDQGQASAMKISITPSVVLLAPPDKVMILSMGMASVRELEDKIIIAMRTEKLLPDSMFESIQYHKRGSLSTEDIKSLGKNEEVDPNDPKQWVDFLKGKLREKY